MTFSWVKWIHRIFTDCWYQWFESCVSFANISKESFPVALLCTHGPCCPALRLTKTSDKSSQFKFTMWAYNTGLLALHCDVSFWEILNITTTIKLTKKAWAIGYNWVSPSSLTFHFDNRTRKPRCSWSALLLPLVGGLCLSCADYFPPSSLQLLVFFVSVTLQGSHSLPSARNHRQEKWTKAWLYFEFHLMRVLGFWKNQP